MGLAAVTSVAAGLALALVAGCTEPADKSSKIELSDGRTVELTQGGAISGVVVDEAIRPLANASVTVLGRQITVSTDESGLFVVPDLDPGLHTLSVSALGYLAIQTTTEVVTGETAEVRVVLVADNTPKPYHTTYAFDWYDEFGVVVVDFALDHYGRGVVPVPLCDQCYFEFQTEPGVRAFVVEATWQDTVAPPHRASEYSWNLFALTQDDPDWGWGYFSSPGRHEVDASQFSNETEWAMHFSGEREWITLEQRAQLFVTAFYLTPPPEGWSIIAGDK